MPEQIIAESAARIGLESVEGLDGSVRVISSLPVKGTNLVRTYSIPQEYAGLFRALVSNELGSVLYHNLLLSELLGEGKASCTKIEYH